MWVWTVRRDTSRARAISLSLWSAITRRTTSSRRGERFSSRAMPAHASGQNRRCPSKHGGFCAGWGGRDSGRSPCPRKLPNGSSNVGILILPDADKGPTEFPHCLPNSDSREEFARKIRARGKNRGNSAKPLRRGIASNGFAFLFLLCIFPIFSVSCLDPSEAHSPCAVAGGFLPVYYK